jgi:hypothetical protein
MFVAEQGKKLSRRFRSRNKADGLQPTHGFRSRNKSATVPQKKLWPDGEPTYVDYILRRYADLSAKQRRWQYNAHHGHASFVDDGCWVLKAFRRSRCARVLRRYPKQR